MIADPPLSKYDRLNEAAPEYLRAFRRSVMSPGTWEKSEAPGNTLLRSGKGATGQTKPALDNFKGRAAIKTELALRM